MTSDVKRQRGPVDDSKKFARELSTLNYGIATREREVKMRAEQNSIANFDTDSRTKRNVTMFSNASSMFDFVDDEIKASLKKTTWKRLSKQYKLKFIKEYIEALSNVSSNDKVLLLRQLEIDCDNLTNVEYIMAENQVVRLNYDWNGTTY